MRAREALGTLSLCLCLALGFPPAASTAESFIFAYLSRQDDPEYLPHRSYTGLTLRDRQPPIDGVNVALRESRVVARATGRKFELLEEILPVDEPASAAILRLLESSRARVFLLDLPATDVVDAVRSLRGRDDLMLFNIRHRDSALRGPDCSPVLFHTIPSDGMIADALAQFLRWRNWNDVLILEGTTPTDKRVSKAFSVAARKFGLDVVDTRAFLLSNNPRERDRTNVTLLTSSASYDVVFVADNVGEFGRYIPYRTAAARPIVGSEGLIASTWHWTWERHGAPQLNQRFDRIAKRRMTEEDWAAWAAVKSVVEAIVRTQSNRLETLREFLYSPEFTLDTYKGTPGSYRPWDNQLRQPLLLHTHNAVVARAPIEGFLHQKNNLDTLGVDERESTCRF